MGLDEYERDRAMGSALGMYAGQVPHSHSGRRPATTYTNTRSRKRNRIGLFAVILGVINGVMIGMTTGNVTTTVLVSLAMTGVTYVAGLWLLSPLARYVEHVQHLATGDFDEEVPTSDDAQYVQLASALEAMRLHLRAWMSQIARHAIEFEGSLQVLDTVHVMHFLRAGKRTGTLLLQRGGETAMLFWRDGEICGALVDGLAGPEALAVPFAWERGSFKFSPRLSPVANLDARWEVLLLNGVRAVQQPRIWSRFIPKTTTLVHRSRLADHMPLRQLLTTDEWTIWSALTGELSAEDLSGRIGESVHKIWHTLYCFAALGVIDLADDRTDFVHDHMPSTSLQQIAVDVDGKLHRQPPGLRKAAGDNVISLHDQRVRRRER